MANTQRRMLHLKIWTSEQFGKLSDKAKLLYIGSITLSDDDGKLRANPAYLRGQIFPYDEILTVTEVLQLRNEVENNGLFIVYSIDKFEYIEHPHWKEYQVIRKDLYKSSSLPTRNVSVTKKHPKLSQVKSSQVKIERATKVATPYELAKSFFSSEEMQNQMISFLIGKSISEPIARQEIGKFITYWTEPTKNGLKVRWELEKVFEIKRRLSNWFSKIKQNYQTTNKGRGIA